MLLLHHVSSWETVASCQPAVGPQAAVLVHVLNRDTEVQVILGECEAGSKRDTEVQAVLGEGEGKVTGTLRSRPPLGKVSG